MTVAAATPARSFRVFTRIMALSLMFPLYLSLDGTTRRPPTRYLSAHIVSASEDDGLDLLREIRSHSDVPVIIMTGHRPDEIDRIVGLKLGADDYIVKPFSLRELLARVRAVLRRQEMGRVARAHEPERGGYRFGGWKLERRGRRLLDAN